MSFDATEGDIQEFFAGCEVTSVRIVEDKLDRKPKGFGYAEFATLDGLKKALEFNGTQFQGRNIRVSVAEPRKSFRSYREPPIVFLTSLFKQKRTEIVLMRVILGIGQGKDLWQTFLDNVNHLIVPPLVAIGVVIVGAMEVEIMRTHQMLAQSGQVVVLLTNRVTVRSATLETGSVKVL